MNFWRSKEKEEYDFVIISGDKVVVIDAQVAIQSAQPFTISSSFKMDFAKCSITPVVCSFGGKLQELSKTCTQVPVTELGNFLLKALANDR